MKASHKAILLTILFVAMFCVLGLFIATHDVAMIDSAGLIGERQRNLLYICAGLMLIVVLPVFILTLIIAYRYREGGSGKHTPDWEHNNWLELIWWGVPFVIIVFLAIITFRTSHELNPFKPLDNPKKAIRIQAVALQWKWLFIYPDLGIATVNLCEFPVDTPLDFEVTADAPMNSFWIPQLGGQIYAMPAMRAKLHLLAKETGTFRGCSSNISGTGFAGMYFDAKSVSDVEFADWVSEVRGASRDLGRAQYERLVEPSSYDPVQYFSRVRNGLFDWIILKYSMPTEESAK